jgi:uroporphyrinogen-III synthase
MVFEVVKLATPLKYKLLAITRDRVEASEFSDLVTSEGGTAIALPAIEIIPKPKSAMVGFINLVNSIKNEEPYCAFLSPRVVDILFDGSNDIFRSDQLVALLNSCTVVAIGPKTKQRLINHGINVKLMPENYSSQGLIELLAKMEKIPGKKIIIPRSEASDDLIEDALSSLKMVVSVFFLYTIRTSGLTPVWKEFVSLLEQKRVDAIVFTSASNVKAFFEITNRILHEEKITTLLRNVKAVITIGPMTSKELKKRDIQYFESEEHTITGTIQVARNVLGRKRSAEAMDSTFRTE